MIDESGNDGQSPVLAMAALLAFDSRWDNLEAEWHAMLSRHRLSAIHCSQLRYDLDFDDDHLSAVMADVEAIVLRHIPLSVIAVMRKSDYDEIYKPIRPVSGAKHSPLGLLYRANMSFFAAFLEDHPPPNLDQVSFIYERGPKEGGLSDIHAAFQSNNDAQDWCGPLTFVGKGDRVALQAADCLAAGALYHERAEHTSAPSDIGQSTLVMTGPTPSSLEAPASFRLPVTRSIIEALRDDLLLTRAQRAELLRATLRST
jgi:hypothetical protein